MNKYKRALTALTHVAFIRADETEQGDKLVRQALYRHLCVVGIAKYENGIIDSDIRFSIEAAEARLKELKENKQ